MSQSGLGDYPSAVGAGIRLKMGLVLQELQWRMGELTHQAMIRAEQLSARDARHAAL